MVTAACADDKPLLSRYCASAIRESTVNAAPSNGCRNHLRQHHSATPVIRTDLARHGARLAADLAAQYRDAQHAAYHMADILLSQAVRDLSAAFADFWRAGDRRERRRCLVWLRRCAATEAHRRTALARSLGAYIRAARAAKGCVA
jgi:hypothetical protein